MALFLTKARARRYGSAERFIRSSLMNIGGEEPFRRRLAASTTSRTFQVVNITITGGASVELVDFFRRCAIEMSWVAIGMSSLIWQKTKTAFSVATLDSAFKVWSLPSADAASA